MGHKTKADRQREARERMLVRELPDAEDRLREAIKYLNDCAGRWELMNLESRAKLLVEKLTLKYFGDTAQAVAELRRILAGSKEGAYVSGPSDVDGAIQQYLNWREAKRELEAAKVMRPYQRAAIKAIRSGAFHPMVDTPANTQVNLDNAVRKKNVETARALVQAVDTGRSDPKLNEVQRQFVVQARDELDMDDPKHAVPPSHNFRHGKR